MAVGVAGCVLLFEEESRRTNVKQRNPSAADISHQSHHTARLNPDASTTTTTRRDITMHSETYSLNSDFGGSFTDTIGGFRPSKFYPKCDHAATPFGVHCAHAAIAREPETLEALWRRRLEILHKETQRRKQCHNYRGNDENNIQTHLITRLQVETAASIRGTGTVRPLGRGGRARARHRPCRRP